MRCGASSAKPMWRAFLKHDTICRRRWSGGPRNSKCSCDSGSRARAGDGQVVLLSGEPGIGKSRLIAAILERARAKPCTMLRYFCSAYHGNSAFHPVIKQLERAAGIGRENSNDTKLDKLELLLRGRTPISAELSPLLADLLSIDASAAIRR